jgi:hypothetical protein
VEWLWQVQHGELARKSLSMPSLKITPSGNTGDLRWFPIDGQYVKETLVFDRADLLKAAVIRLRKKVVTRHYRLF